MLDYSGVIGTTVKCKIDRPLGSAHPKHSDIVYPVNYGFVPEVFAGDGAEQDVYVLGVDKPLEEFTGKVLAVYHRLNDVNQDTGRLSNLVFQYIFCYNEFAKLIVTADKLFWIRESFCSSKRRNFVNI